MRPFNVTLKLPEAQIEVHHVSKNCSSFKRVEPIGVTLYEYVGLFVQSTTFIKNNFRYDIGRTFNANEEAISVNPSKYLSY